MKKKSIISVILVVCLLLGTVGQAIAATTQQEISDAKDKQEATQSILEETQALIRNLESKREQSEAYLSQLNDQLDKLKAELAEYQTAYENKKAELERVQAELEVAKRDEQEQYEAMKIRIQYMYENSMGNNYLGLLLGSTSISSMLNQAENISKMTEYDREMLELYENTKNYIAQKEKEVAAEKDAIMELWVACEERQAAVEELVQATYDQIREYQANLSAQESMEHQLLQQIEEQQEEINALLKRAKEEEAARILAAKKAAEEAAAKKAAEEAAQKAAEEEAKKKAEEEAKKKAEEEAKKKAEEEAQKKAEEEAKKEAEEEAKKKAEEEAKKKAEEEAKKKAEEEAKKKEEEEAAKKEQENNNSSSEKKYLGRFKLTAYCACSKCCGNHADGYTASGTKATEGRTIAMAGLPFGTKLSINGTVYTVEDRGTAYGHIDVFMSSHSRALQFGVKYADVYQLS